MPSTQWSTARMPVDSHSHSGVCTVTAGSSTTARGIIPGCRNSSLTRCRSSITPAMALNSPADNVVGTVTCGTEGGLHGGGPTTPSGPFTGRYWSSVSVLRMSFARQSCTAFAPPVTEPPPIVTIRSAPASRAIAAASITARRGVCGGIWLNRPANRLPSARRIFTTSSVVRFNVPLAITNTRSAWYRRASSATTSVAGLPNTTSSISPKTTRPECTMVFPPLAGGFLTKPSAVQSQSADCGQFQRRHGGVDADIEPEDVELESLVGGEQDTGEPEERELEPGAAGCRGKHGPTRQKVFADRVRRQVEAELRNLPGNKAREGIAVGAGPGAVLVRIRIACDRGADGLDQRVDTGAAPVENDLRPVAEPVIVRARPVDPDRRGAACDAKAEHLVSRVPLGPGRLDREPRMHREHPAPRDGAGGIDLHHRLRCFRRVGCQASGVAARLVPRHPAAPVGQATADQHRQYEQPKQQQTGRRRKAHAGCGGLAHDAGRPGRHVVKGQGHRDAGVVAHQGDHIGDADMTERLDRAVVEPFCDPARIGEGGRHLVDDLLALIGKRSRQTR